MKKPVVLLLIFASFALTGCGSEAEASAQLQTYGESLLSYCDTINENQGNINNMDVTSPDASARFLEYIDNIDYAFSGIYNLEIPVGFEELQIMANNGFTYMDTADMLYHEIYETGDYSAYNMDKDHEAYNNYVSAIECLNKMGNELLNKTN